MADQEKKPIATQNLEVTELEDADLEDVAGGHSANLGCPTTNNCPVTNNCAPGTMPGNTTIEK